MASLRFPLRFCPIVITASFWLTTAHAESAEFSEVPESPPAASVPSSEDAAVPSTPPASTPPAPTVAAEELAPPPTTEATPSLPALPPAPPLATSKQSNQPEAAGALGKPKKKKKKKGQVEFKHNAAKPAWELAPPKLSGYIQVHYRHAFSTGVDPLVDYDDFRVQRVRLGVQGAVFPWLSYDVEIDPRATESSGVLRDVFVGFKVIPRHVIRVGQQKTQFGYENVKSSTKLWAVNRTEVSDNLSRGPTLRDVGVGLIGNVKLKGGFRIEDAVTVVNGAGMNVQSDDTQGKDVWGRLGMRYARKRSGNLVLRLGASGAAGDHVEPGDDLLSATDDFRLKFERLGADLELDQQWFFLSSELVLGWEQNMVTRQRDEPFGYYVNLVGKTAWRVGPIARYDVLGDDYQRGTFGAFYGLPDEHFRVLLNYELRLLKGGVRADDKLYAWLQVRF